MNSNIWPGLQYQDASAALRWLSGTFGFVEAIVVPGRRPDEIVHAELRWPEGGTVMLHSAGDGDFAAFNRPGTNSVYVVTGTPDDLYARATAAGAPVLRELRDEDYGSRGFSVTDPEGNAWSFGTYAGASSDT